MKIPNTIHCAVDNELLECSVFSTAKGKLLYLFFLNKFWTNVGSSNKELNLFGNLLASDKNIGLANF